MAKELVRAVVMNIRTSVHLITIFSFEYRRNSRFVKFKLLPIELCHENADSRLVFQTNEVRQPPLLTLDENFHRFLSFVKHSPVSLSPLIGVLYHDLHRRRFSSFQTETYSVEFRATQCFLVFLVIATRLFWPTLETAFVSYRNKFNFK